MSTSQPVPSIVDRTKTWLRLLKRRAGPPSIRVEKSGTGSFSHARDFTISGGQLIDTVNGGQLIDTVNEMKINYINNVISNRDAVFELLEPYACLEATKDSSARYPPPRCHDKTRLKIRGRLRKWLVEEYDEWKMLWVRGSAGTGKSAVAQSFGDSCEEDENLGGSYFFSRTTGRNKLETVVPTIVYQLARSVPEYHSLVEHRLAKDQLLLRSSPPVQFRKLIVEPFATLQRQHTRKPIVIILDGLDECDGEKAQREILEMITNAIRTNPDLPLRWLIFSRPEAHLKNAFSRNSECGREELIIDDECREDVERYVKDRVTETKATYNDIITEDWPPPDQLQELLDAVSGLFVFASTCLNYIDDPEEADPRSQFDFLLSFIRRSQGVLSRNPLAALDLLYSRILEVIPPTVFKTTRRILAYMSLQNKLGDDLMSAQALCNFLRLDRPTFYKAARGLHSVMRIPEPEDAANSHLQFYHASFLDFLLDSHRSGKFTIDEQEALKELVYLGIDWYEVDVTHFHTDSTWTFDHTHNHDSLPGLTWASEDVRLEVSKSISRFIGTGLFGSYRVSYPNAQLGAVDDDFLQRISGLNFRYWYAWSIFAIARYCQLDPSTSVVRVQPSSPTDHQLLEYLNLVISNGIAKPATLPLREPIPKGRWIREYFFVGHGVRSAIVCITKSSVSDSTRMVSIRSDREFSGALVSEYVRILSDIGWDEEKAKLEMG